MTSTPKQDAVNHVAGARGDAHGNEHGASADRLFFGSGRRVPVVLQTEAAECGLACLAMVTGYHGHHTTLPALRRRFSLSLKVTSNNHLIAAGSHSKAF